MSARALTLLLAVFAFGIAAADAPVAGAQPATVRVFAAASLRNALDDLNAAYGADTGVKVVASYAATSALMRQIQQGAPADVVVSADREWMDFAVQKGLVQDDTRVDLLGNRLVLIAPKESRLADVPIGPGLDLGKLAGDGRIVTGNVRAVPVGRYAKAALEHLGAWQNAQAKLAMTENVRAALSLVARGEAPLGIVYATDAAVEPGVKVVGIFPEGSHPPIVYPAAATAPATPQAQSYLAFLRSPAAKAVFEKYGFTFLARPTS